MVRTLSRTTRELREEKDRLLRDSAFSETELLRRGENWAPMDDKHWDLYERLEGLNWLIADDPERG